MEKNYPQQKGVIDNMAGTEVSVMKELKGILATDNVKNRFNEVLGKKAPQFMTSIINVVSQNNQLKSSWSSLNWNVT